MDYLDFGIELICVVALLGLLAPVASLGYGLIIDASPFRRLQLSSKLAFFNAAYYLILTSAIVHVCDRHRLDSNTIEMFLIGFVTLVVLAFHDSQENVKQIKQENERRILELFPVRSNFASARFQWIIPIQLIALILYPLICFFPDQVAHATASDALVNSAIWLREVPLVGMAFHLWAFFVGFGMLISFGTLSLMLSLWMYLRTAPKQGAAADAKAA